MVFTTKSVSSLGVLIRSMLSYRLLFLLGVALVALSGSLAKSLSFHSEYVYALELWLGSDKYLHFIVSFAIGYTVTWATPFRLRRYFFYSVGVPTLVTFLAIVSDEFLQIYVPTREFSYEDLLANVLGMGSGIFVCRFLEMIFIYLSKRKEEKTG